MRALAAIAVFICHLFSLVPEMARYKNHFTNLFTNWGTESVIVFFILSGIVIHLSFENRPKTKIEFIKNRVLRLYPILICCVILTALIEKIIFKTPFSLMHFIANALPIATLDTSITLYQSNPVIWSLSFEVFFYLYFGLFCIRNKKLNNNMLYLWAILGLICIYLNVQPYVYPKVLTHFFILFALSFIWLIGFYIVKFRQLYSSSHLAILSLFSLPLLSRLHLFFDHLDPVKYTLFAIVSWPFFLYLIRKKEQPVETKNNLLLWVYAIIFLGSAITLSYDKQYSPFIKACYIFLPIFMLIMFNFFGKLFKYIYSKIIKPLAHIGKFSYSLYLVHYPIIVLFVGIPTISFAIKLPLILISTGIAIYLFEFKLQPYFNRLFKSN
ncbi:hypothetical protein DBR40_17135 [Pedobacter sp. KBW01]|nr:hypothetical protein DBR40_17135 [Pedobacter sp. KBW01]